MSKNIFISIEGIDGCGKTTLGFALKTKLNYDGYSTIFTEEPTCTRIGQAVRDIVIDQTEGDLDNLSQAMFFSADRAVHLRKVIEPKLALGFNVICGRFIDSSLAYQGINNELSFKITEINKIITGITKPELTFLLDIPVEDALIRIKESSRDNFEKLDFLTEVRERFLVLAYKEKERIIVLNGLMAKEELLNIAYKIIVERIK